MQQDQTDTIAAIATAPGVGGIGIVRISGGQALTITRGLTRRSSWRPRRAYFCHFEGADKTPIDSGLCLYFPAPNSFTGEDVVELQAHGGPVILDLLLRRVLQLGARQARPGEFSERAFLNGKLDLAQAEAIADLIESDTAAAARAAQRSLQGVFSDKVNQLLRRLIELRVFVEAAIDFPDEEIDFLADSDVLQQLQQAAEQADQLCRQAHQGQLLRDGITVAIIGRPNAGKSSLLNALAGRDVAIVTDVPGTTRDVLTEQIAIDGIPVHIADTAGIRETSDQIEAEGVRRARDVSDNADVVLWVVDDSRAEQQIQMREELPEQIPVIEIHNKIDLTAEPARVEGLRVHLSAKTGEGLDLLRQTIRRLLNVQSGQAGTFSARRRHLEALQQVQQHLQQGQQQLSEFHAGELLAEELRQAQLRLSEITGAYTTDDLLGDIFSSFCIGK